MEPTTPTEINWKTLLETGKREGPPYGTKPTRAMVYNLESPRYKSYLMDGKQHDYYVEFDREYAVSWCRHNLAFLSSLAPSDRDKFLSEVFPREPEKDLPAVSTHTKAVKKRVSRDVVRAEE